MLRSLMRQYYHKKVIEPAREGRRKAQRAMPHVCLEAKHTAGSSLLPDRETLIKLMPKGAVVAEFGVANGDFSRQIVDLCQPAELHLVDAWTESRYNNDRQKAERNLAAEIDMGIVKIHQGYSTTIMDQFGSNRFDWIYIDTDHSYATTADELRKSDRLIKTGGCILGHDFCTGNIITPIVYGVIEAVNEFCVSANWRYRYLTLESGGHFSFCIERIEAERNV